MSSKDLSSRTNRSARVLAARAVPLKPNDGERQCTSDCESSANDDENDVPVAADENTSILSLNDDCILEVFSHLRTEDLLAVKKCCRRFSYLADFTAERRFRKNEDVVLLQEGNLQSLRLAAKMLLNFGRYFTRLYIHFYGNEFIQFCDRKGDPWTFASLMQDCTSLKSLKLWETSFPVRKLKAIFGNIERLEVGLFRDVKEIDAMLNATKKLKHLILVEIFHSQGFLIDLSCVDLQTITLIVGAQRLSDTRPFLRFLNKLHPMKNLETIELGTLKFQGGNCRNERNIEAMTELGQNLNDFEHLKIFKLHSSTDFSTDIQTFATRFDVIYDSHSKIMTATRK